MALAYLLCLSGSLLALAVLLRRRPTPTIPPKAPAPAPASLPANADTEIRAILVAAAQLASRMQTAA